ncbi:MAG: DNA-directed RNA polymerase subunit omega [Planctomycetia bacterium]|nr:DNA-directed RNA polymerase subunit omega [Planctomycetia bacterium]
MIDELRDESLKKKVGGGFKLTTLIQKRLCSLNQGARPLVYMPGASNLEIVIAEIVQDKIYLSLKNELRTIEDQPADVPDELGFDDLGLD